MVWWLSALARLFHFSSLFLAAAAFHFSRHANKMKKKGKSCFISSLKKQKRGSSSCLCLFPLCGALAGAPAHNPHKKTKDKKSPPMTRSWKDDLLAFSLFSRSVALRPAPLTHSKKRPTHPFINSPIVLRGKWNQTINCFHSFPWAPRPQQSTILQLAR